MAIQIKNRKKQATDNLNSNQISESSSSSPNEYEDDNGKPNEKNLKNVTTNCHENLIRQWFTKKNGIANKNTTNDLMMAKISEYETEFPLAITFRINIMVLILFSIAFGFRIYELDQPRSIVFVFCLFVNH